MRELCIIAAVVALVAICGASAAFADDCVCEHCSGDPVFVQRDQRMPRRALELRLSQDAVGIEADGSKIVTIILKGNEPTVRTTQ